MIPKGWRNVEPHTTCFGSSPSLDSLTLRLAERVKSKTRAKEHLFPRTLESDSINKFKAYEELKRPAGEMHVECNYSNTFHRTQISR